MREALVAPLDFTSLRNAVPSSNSIATSTRGKSNSTDDDPASQWRVGCISQRGESPVSENESLDNEITAALEVGYLLRWHTTPRRWLNRRCMSRVPDLRFDAADLVYAQCTNALLRLVTQPWFIGHSQRENRHRAVRGSLRNRNTQAILNRRLPSVSGRQ